MRKVEEVLNEIQDGKTLSSPQAKRTCYPQKT